MRCASVLPLIGVACCNLPMYTGEKLGSALREAMRLKGVTQAEVADAFGVTQPSVSEWLRYGRIGKRHITRLVEWFSDKVGPEHWGMPASWSSSPQPIDLDAHPDLVSIRSVTLRLQAGVSGFAVEQADGNGSPIFFRADWMQSEGYKPQNLVAIKVSGRSMEPGLNDGDMVVVNTAETIPLDGEAYAVNYEGEPVVKRLIRDAGEWWLSSDNPDQRRYPRKECSGDGCIIVGRVIHKQSTKI
jgi:transcriptional regulator with XRE-family HTH domain